VARRDRTNHSGATNTVFRTRSGARVEPGLRWRRSLVVQRTPFWFGSFDGSTVLGSTRKGRLLQRELSGFGTARARVTGKGDEDERTPMRRGGTFNGLACGDGGPTTTVGRTNQTSRHCDHPLTNLPSGGGVQLVLRNGIFWSDPRGSTSSDSGTGTGGGRYPVTSWKKHPGTYGGRHGAGITGQGRTPVAHLRRRRYRTRGADGLHRPRRVGWHQQQSPPRLNGWLAAF